MSSLNPRKFINGFPLLVMQSIASRASEGATAFEIENDLEDASKIRPAPGAVFSTLGTLAGHGHVLRTEEDIEDRQTAVFRLTACGANRREWMLSAIAKAGELKEPAARGPRVSGPARRRRRRRNGC